MHYPCHMRMDLKKATLGGAWLIALGIEISDVVVTGANWALVFGMGVVPAVIIWMFRTPPAAILSPSIAKVRQ